MSRAQRLLDLIQLLRRHRYAVSGAALAKELGVSHFLVPPCPILDLGADPTTGGANRGDHAMIDPNFILLYVDKPEASAAFYTELLGHSPIETSPTFALFKLASGVMLGFWSKHTAEPAATAAGGGGELGFPVASREALDATLTEWKGRGLPILQAPVDLDFGYTFVALDPDGHRLRVFFPTGE